MKQRVFILVISLFLLLLVACQGEEVQNPVDENGSNTEQNNTTEQGGEDAEEEESSILNEPVTLTLWNRAMGIINNEVAEQMFKPVLDKYPNVTIEVLENVNIEEMIATGEVPDLIATSNYYLLDHMLMELAGDVSEFLERDGFSLDALNPAIVENLEVFAEINGTPGAVLGIPVSMNQGVLAYNKDIFDAFGVPYPEPGMTWEEVIELSRQVTGHMGGTDYIGFSPGGVQTISRALSLDVVDENDEANIHTPEYQMIFEWLEELYNIPGVVNGETYNYNFNFFMEERRLAMIPYWIAAFTSRIPLMEETGLNWGITSFPTTSDNPGLGREIDYHLFVIPETAKNREAAIKVASELMTEEAQIYLGREVLRLTVLDNDEVRKAYGEGSGLYEQEELEAVFSVQPSPTPRPTIYDREIYGILGEAQRKLAVEKMDVQTVLREAQEEATTKVREMRDTQ